MAEKTDENQNQNPQPNTPPKSTDIVDSNAKEVRQLQERLSKAEKQNQDLSGELSGLRDVVAQLGKMPPKNPDPSIPKRKTLLDEINEMVFGPSQQ
jgi:chaperonin cofactor prefoldin